MNKTILALLFAATLATVAIFFAQINSSRTEASSSTESSAAAAQLATDERAVSSRSNEPNVQPNEEYMPKGEAFSSIEASVANLTERELRHEAVVITAKLAPQIETARSRRLTLEEQRTLTESIRKQSAIYKILAERGMERLRKRL